MRLDENRINLLETELRNRLTELDIQFKRARHREQDTISDEIEEISDRLAALTRLKARNAASLPKLPKNVFVSTNLMAGGDPPPWVRGVAERVNGRAEEADLGTYKFHYGKTFPGGVLQDEIFKRIVECYCFLTLVGPPSEKNPGYGVSEGITGYLQEEIGVAFALAKPIVIAVPYGVEPRAIGNLLGDTRQRFVYDFNRDNWEDTLAGNLEKALRVALQD